MTTAQLLRVASQVLATYPQSTVTGNAVGNLAVIDGETYVGWIDVTSGEFCEVEP